MSTISDKALAHVDAGRVRETPSVRCFTVDSATVPGRSHQVIVQTGSQLDATCTCDAGRRRGACSHAVAALLVVVREREVLDARARSMNIHVLPPVRATA